MKNYTQVDKQGFEIESCSRCGGSGRYSWCQQWGDTCFKCKGLGTTLTKRGEAARDMFKESRKVEIVDLKIGDKCFWMDGIFYKSAWATVTEISTSGNCITISAGDHYGVCLDANSDTKIVVSEPSELYAERLAAALAYQDSLTKGGSP